MELCASGSQKSKMAALKEEILLSQYVHLLALLDVSAAFDTVDHGILLERLSTSYGLSGMAYTWLESYITGRAQIIHVGNRHSPPSKVLYGVPQGSVLGLVLYVLYTSDVAKLVEALGLGAHLYADDTQLYGHCSPANSLELASRVLRAIDSIHEWMSSNRLSLSLSTQARHNSFDLVRSTVLQREIQIGSTVYFRP